MPDDMLVQAANTVEELRLEFQEKSFYISSDK